MVVTPTTRVPLFWTLNLLLLILISFGMPVLAQSTQSTCPGADSNDESPDDAALNACLNGGGTVVLERGDPGYIIATGLRIEKNGVTLTSPGTDVKSAALLVADPHLRAPMLHVVDGVFGYTLSNLVFQGNRSHRIHGKDCASDFYGTRSQGYNLLIRGKKFQIEKVWSLGALCGSAMEADTGDLIFAELPRHQRNGLPQPQKSKRRPLR
jgi:hypothetical protein